MQLSEYFEIRNGSNRIGKPIKAMSKGEARILGLDMTKSGWANVNTDYSEEDIKKCILHVIKSDWINIKFRNRLYDYFSKANFAPDQQKLYLFKNSQGLYKIGISKDPFKRAQSLANASGYKISVSAIWEMPSARKQEQDLHKAFYDQREVGEWFSGLLTIEMIESKITQDFKLIYSE